jgi:hypothetical protein
VITERQREVLVITQEEAAEVIKEISKVFRFGIDQASPDGVSHRDRLQTEIGDLLCMIDVMIDNRLLDPVKIEIARQAKIGKLRKYSRIYP